MRVRLRVRGRVRMASADKYTRYAATAARMKRIGER